MVHDKTEPATLGKNINQLKTNKMETTNFERTGNSAEIEHTTPIEQGYDQSVILAVELLVLDCHFRRGYDHREKLNSLYDAVSLFHHNMGEPKTKDELYSIVTELMYEKIHQVTRDNEAGLYELLNAHPDFQREVLCDASVSNNGRAPIQGAKKNQRR